MIPYRRFEIDVISYSGDCRQTIHEHECGDWVPYEDAEKLAGEVRRLWKKLNDIAESFNPPFKSIDERTETLCTKCGHYTENGFCAAPIPAWASGTFACDERFSDIINIVEECKCYLKLEV